MSQVSTVMPIKPRVSRVSDAERRASAREVRMARLLEARQIDRQVNLAGGGCRVLRKEIAEED